MESLTLMPLFDMVDESRVVFLDVFVFIILFLLMALQFWPLFFSHVFFFFFYSPVVT